MPSCAREMPSGSFRRGVRDDIADGTRYLLDVDTSDTKGPVGLTMRTDTPPLPAFPILLATIREAAGLANGMRA